LAKQALSDELKRYGYDYSLKKSILLYFFMVLLMIFLGRFFRLNGVCQVVLCVAGTAFLPFFIRNSLKNRYEKQRFSEANIYMEQFLYSFQRTGKILATLEDVKSIFEEGPMKKTIEKAVSYMKNTYNESGIMEKGLAIIEKEYSFEGMDMIHGFALDAERLGGDYGDSVNLLLNYRRMNADRAYDLMQEKKKRRRDVFLSVVTSLLLCSVIYFMASRLEMDLTTYPIASAITLMVLLLDIFIFYRADFRFAEEEWDETEEEKEALRQYKRYQRYSEKSLIDRMGKKAAKKGITENIEKVFPRWLMQLALLLQTESVPVAILKSHDKAPMVLRPEIEAMLVKMKARPDSMEPYLEFLEEFTLPEVKSTMKMLYSLSAGKGGDAGEQIADIIRRNQRLMNRSKEIMNEESMSGMYFLFLAPQVTGGVKLVADLLILFVVYMSQSAQFLN